MFFQKNSCNYDRFYGITSHKRCSIGSESGKERICIVNTILFQKYHVLSLLGSGGSSSVYLAEHLKLNQYRAIKCIPKSLSRKASLYAEAGLLKNLRHPGIPMIYDTEEDDNYFYIIEEYIQGESLSVFVQSQDNISQETIIFLGIQLCEIIEYLHNQTPSPILYLDLKPEHIILCRKQLKLIDFGIATEQKDNKALRQSFGTPGFAAPEQYTKGELNQQTDIFGIGAILYYMLNRESLPPLLKASYTFPKYCSNNFKKIILKATAPSANCRHRKVEQLRRELEKLNSGHRGRLPKMHLLEKIIVTGSQQRVGTTHIAVSLVCWWNQQGRKAYYQEKEETGFLQSLAAGKKGVVWEKGICHYRNFQALQPAIDISHGNPHILIQDYGSDTTRAAEDEDAKMIILVTGGRPWELKQGIQAFERLADEENLVVLCNYNDRQTAGKYAEILQRKIFCFPLDKDAFARSEEKNRLFRQMFRERREEGFGSKA